MKTFKKVVPSERDSVTTRSSFLSAIGARRSIRSGRLQSIASQRDSVALEGQQPAAIVASESSKGFLNYCLESDSAQIKASISSRQFISKILQTLNSPIDVYGNTCLHLVVLHNDYLLAGLLLLKGADPNLANRSGITPTISALRLYGVSSPTLELLALHGGKTKNELTTSSGLCELPVPTKKEEKETKSEKPTLIITVTESLKYANQTFKRDTSNTNGSSEFVSTFNMIHEDVKTRVLNSIPTTPLSPFTSAYLGKPFNAVGTAWNLKNRMGQTALMIAAFKGNLDIVKQMLTSGQGVSQLTNLVDNRGLTALSYACYSGHLDVVKLLVEEGTANVNGAELPGIQPWVEIFIPSPLILASFSGKYRVVEYLVTKGADVHIRVGAPKGCNALMIACWMRRFEVIKVLIGAGSSASAETGDWLKEGLRKLKKISMECHDIEWDTQSWHTKFNRLGVSKSLNSTLLTTEDIEDVSQIIGMLRMDPIKMKKCLAENDEGVEDEFSLSNDVMASDIQGAGSDFHEVTIDLTERLPRRGTELDAAYLEVFQSVLQLAMGANKHDKTSYVVTSAKAVRFSSVIASLVENMKALDRPSCVPISPHFSAIASNQLLESSLFSKSYPAQKLMHHAQKVCTEYNENLVFSTKIACGIWPPPTALTEMIQAAASLSKQCRILVDLANVFGFYPVLDRKLSLQVEKPIDIRASGDIESLSPVQSYDIPASRWPRPNQLTYQKYVELNGLSNVEQLSKTMSASFRQESSQNESHDIDMDEEFFKSLELTLKRFVVSVTELKKLQTQKLKDKYMAATKQIASRATEIIEEIQDFDLFVDFADSFDSVMLEEADVKEIESTGVFLRILVFPAPALGILDLVQQEVIETSNRVEDIGREASMVWSSLETERKMLESCYPCVLAVKKLFSVAKTVAHKIRLCWEGDLKRRQEWNRKTTQNEDVQALFQAWSGCSNSSADVDIAKLMLDDTSDGILIDSKGSGLKGGKISRIVELITSHNGFQPDWANTLLMCHHSFITSIELFKIFCSRYELIVPPPNLNAKEFTAWLDLKCKTVQQNVIRILTMWIDQYYEEDFLMNEMLSISLREFIDKIVTSDWHDLGRRMTNMLDLKMNGIKQLASSQSKAFPRQNVPRAFGLFSGVDPSAIFSDSSRIVEMDSMEFARQLTLHEFEGFMLVRPSECLQQIWSKKINDERAAAKLLALNRKNSLSSKSSTKEYISAPESAISKMIAHTNNLSLWIATTILSCTNVKVRVLILKYFATCAIKCRELHNYNGITGIVAGLSMAPIARLHRTWRKFAKHYSGIFGEYEECAALVSPTGQYANYRRELKDIKLPAIPFLGVYLTDITFIDL